MHHYLNNCTSILINFMLGCDKNKGDIAFLLDSSRSVLVENWIKILDFVTNIVQELEIDEDTHRIGKTMIFGIYSWLHYFFSVCAEV